MNKFFLSLLLILTTACSTCTQTRRVANFDTIATSYNKVAILPAEVVINVQGAFNTKERQDNHEYFLEDIINREAVFAFQKAGYSAKFFSKRMMHDLSISRYLPIVKEEYTQHRNSLYKTLVQDTKIAYDMSPYNMHIMQKFKEAYKDDVDAFIIIDFEGELKSSGAILKDAGIALLVGRGHTAPDEQYVLYMGIIDARSHNVTWINAEIAIAGALSGVLSSKEKLETQRIQRLLDACLAKLRPKK